MGQETLLNGYKSAIKRCRLCAELKGLDEFHKATGMKDGHRSECKACFRINHRAWYQRNRAKVIEKVRVWQRDNRERHLATQRLRRERDRERLRAEDRKRWLDKKYGLTPETFDQLLTAQGHKCAICKKPGGIELHVDHDHRRDEVRGLLCGKCNRAIGLMDEDPQIVRSAETYLVDWRLKPYKEMLQDLEESVATTLR